VQYNKQCIEKPDMNSGGVAFFNSNAASDSDLEQETFYNAITRGDELLVKPEQAIIVTKILEAIYESGKTGKTVYFN
jgi:predicted dehydrogenase